MRRCGTCWGLWAALMAAAPCGAQDGDGYWPDVSAELGWVATSGNTRNRSLHGSLDTESSHERWRQSTRFQVLRLADAGGVSAERYVLSGKASYRLSDMTRAASTLRGERDRFGAYRYQVSESLGLAWRVFGSAATRVELEAGLGARQVRMRAGGSQEEAMFRLGLDLNSRLSPTASLSSESFREFAEESALTESVTSLRIDVAADLGMKLSFTARHNRPTPEGRNPLDTIMAVTLVYEF